MDMEGRVTALENSLGTLNKIAADQMLHNREIDHNMTILLGVARSQGQDLREVKERLESAQTSLERIEGRLTRVELRLEGIEDRLARMESHLEARLDAIMALLRGKQPKPPEH